MKMFLFAGFAVFFGACGGSVEASGNDQKSCTVIEHSASSTYETWQFLPVPETNPDPASCVDQGGGAYLCQTLTGCTFDEGDCRRCTDFHGNIVSAPVDSHPQ